MLDDPRCCGSGTCIIDPEGRCWCGQVWDGQRMAAPSLAPSLAGHPTPAASSRTTGDPSRPATLGAE